LIPIPCDHLKVVLKVCGRLRSVPDSEFGRTSAFSTAMAKARLYQLAAQYHFSWVIVAVLRGFATISMRISYLWYLGQ
jgi:hypothetical protein